MFSQIQTETVQHLNYGARVLVSVIFVPFDRLDSVTNTLEAVCVVDPIISKEIRISPRVNQVTPEINIWFSEQNKLNIAADILVLILIYEGYQG